MIMSMKTPSWNIGIGGLSIFELESITPFSIFMNAIVDETHATSDEDARGKVNREKLTHHCYVK